MGEMQKKGKSGVVSLNIKKPKRPKIIKESSLSGTLRTAQPKKEKDLETTREREGRVKFYSITAGYGFISEEGIRDYFFHHTQIDDEGKSLGTGDRVSFIAKTSPKGWQAVEVRRAK